MRRFEHLLTLIDQVLHFTFESALHKDQEAQKWRLEKEGSDRAVKTFNTVWHFVLPGCGWSVAARFASWHTRARLGDNTRKSIGNQKSDAPSPI
jgi:hypothetical protein